MFSADTAETPTPTDPDDKGTIVDLLLADVRSGFRKMGETNFSVTKVQKINLDLTNVPNSDGLSSPVAESPTGFVRGGSLRRSIRSKKRTDSAQAELDASTAANDELNQTGSRRSYAVDTDGTLFDILMQQDNDTANGSPSGSFSRIGSLRRRRSERHRDRENVLSVDSLGRERAASPNIEAQKKEVDIKERPKSDILDDDFDYRRDSGVRRTRSLHDKSASADSTPRRMYDPNNNKSEDNLSIDSSSTPTFRSEEPHRRSSRWRADIPDIKGLPRIDEKSRLVTPTKEIDVLSKFLKPDKTIETPKVSKDDSYAMIEKKNKDILCRRLSTSNLQESIRVLETAEDVKNKTDEHTTISRSVRSKLNTRWHSELNKTDIDNVLKAIEDTGRQIEEIVNIEPQGKKSKETVTASMHIPPYNPTVDKKVVPQGDPNEPENLKVKRKSRKERSHVSLEDISAAFKMNKMQSTDPADTGSNTDVENHEMPTAPKSPAVPPRMSKRNSDGTMEKIETDDKADQKAALDKEAVNKAAKLAGKKRFRDQRFGDKDRETPSQKAMLEHSQGRWKSNVEKENVDEAFRDYMSKNNMSRSKSYDEAVARKAMNDEGDFVLNVDDKRNSFRNSAAKMYNDDRRNGKIFDDDSDAENAPIIANPNSRPSSTASTRSDSPRSSSSRLSIKSTNTSTETLRETCSDSENSPEQKRKNSISKGLADKLRDAQTPSPSLHNKISETRPETPLAVRAEYLIGNMKDESGLLKYKELYDENDDSPQAAMAKWRKKRSQKERGDRTSLYDNVHVESGNLSPRTIYDDMKGETTVHSPRSEPSHAAMSVIHKSQGSNELQNDIGSRCSYASSSDSASKDEGFETMSGTVSQRTSLSSTLESVDIFNAMPKKTEMSRLQINENIIVANAQSSVSDTRKQRTESWTEAVANSTVLNNKDSSLDSSTDFSATSPDSGHGTLKDEVWHEPSDLESTLKARESMDSRPMSPASSVTSIGKKTKSVPSYMRGTASSSGRKQSIDTPDTGGRRSSTSSSMSVSKSKRPSIGASNQSLSKARTGSNTSIVSITSNASETGGVTSGVKKRDRLSQGMARDRPASIHSSMPGSRSITPLPREARAQTPTQKLAAKPAAHASSVVGARNASVKSQTTPKTTKTRPAPAPPSGSKTPTPRQSSSSTTGRTTPLSSGRTTPVSRLRSTTPVSSPPSAGLRSTTPSIEEETDVVDINAPSRLKRSQSMRVKSSTARPSLGSTPVSKEAPAKSAAPRLRASFMSPTASSKARVDKLKTEETSPPPTPPPRRSKDTDALPRKSDETHSPLKRHASLRLPGKSANKTGREQEKTGVKGFIQKIGGGGSKVRPESDGKLAPVDESSEKDAAEEGTAKEGGKSPSLRKILTFRGKDKSTRKSTDSLKSDSSERKRKPSK